MRPLPAPLLVALPCLACSVVEIEVEPPPIGIVVATFGETMPEDVQPAHIYEIDERPVMYQRRRLGWPGRDRSAHLGEAHLEPLVPGQPP